jgi:hypothetical protein
LIIQITNINFQYEEGNVTKAQVFFSGHNGDRTINLNGSIPLTGEEYTGNESFAALKEIVKQRVSDSLVTTSI